MRKTVCKALKKEAIKQTDNKKSVLMINRKTGVLRYNEGVRRIYQDLKKRYRKGI